MSNGYFESGYDLVEILGEFIGDELAGDEFAGDDFAGDDFVGAANPRNLRMGGGSRGMPRGPSRGPGGMRPGMRPQGGGRPGLKPGAQALINALAERRAMAGALLHERAPSKSREYPLGFASDAPVAAGASASITTRPQVPFRLDRLVVPSDLAGLFTIDDVKVGKNSQFAAEGAVPARIFQENGVGVCLKGDTAQISMNVTIRVTNISGAASMFRAAVIGPAVE
jgi:hypothetical protein